MKWKSEKPEIGERRRVTRFAFFPTLCTDGYVHWLCRIHVTKVWGATHRSASGRKVWRSVLMEEWTA